MAQSQAVSAESDDPLASWSEGVTKRSIVDFFARVTKAGGEDYVHLQNASPPSTTTARCGPNSLSTSSSPLPSIGSRR
jgi:hypothetical protein